MSLCIIHLFVFLMCVHCVLCAVHQLLLNCFIRCNEMVFNSHICCYCKLMPKVNTKEGLGEEIKIIYLFLDVECENYTNDYSSIKP